MARDRTDQLELPVAKNDRRAESRRLMEQLRGDADRIAARFGLTYKRILAERRGVNEHYGVCYADGEIRIRLRHAVTGRPLRYSSLIDTLCHELAHLRHFDHGERFEAFFEQMLEWCRKEGIYQPQAVTAPREAAAGGDAEAADGPDQLPLFGDPRLRALIGRGGSR